MTPHHLIFCHTPAPAAENPPVRPRELWITYPIIQICTLRPNPPQSRLPSSIRLRCRDFTFVCFCFNDEKKARDVYDSIKAWTCKLGRIEKLYAFSYQPQSPEKEVNGWQIYDPRREWKRLGISEKGTDKGWRISNINTDYGVSLLDLRGYMRDVHPMSSSRRRILLYYLYLRQYLTIHSTTLAGTAHACGFLC